MATSTIVYALVGRDRASAVFRQVGRNANRLASTSSKIGAAIKTGLAVGAVGVVGLGAASLKAAGDFEKNMNRVAALSGATGKNLEKLRNQAKDFGKTTQYGAAQSADAMAQLATAGLDVNQIYGSMPSVLALASSEQLNLTRAAEITTNVLTGYGMSIKEIPHAVDAMVKASVKANTSVDDLGEAFKYSGPIAHQAGIQFEEAVAATALMGNAGIKASMAGTALRGAITRLLSPTKKVATTLTDLGVSVATSDGKLRPLTSIVDQLAKKGATTGQIMTIFGQRAGPGMAALIQQGSAKLAGLTKELENSGGTADKIAKIQMKGLKGEVTRLKNAWEGLMIEVGDTGLLTGATKALSKVTFAVRDLAGWVNDDGIPKVKAFAGNVADMVPVNTIKQRFGQAKAIVTDFFAGLSGKGTVDLGIPRVDAMPDVVPKSQAADIGRQIRDAFTGGIRGIDWKKIGGAVGLGLGKAVETGVSNVGKLTVAFGKLLAGIDWVGIGIGLGKFVPSLLLGFIVGLLNFDIGGLLKGLAAHWQDALLAVLFVAFLPAKWAGAIGKALGKIPFLGKLLSWSFEIFTKFSKTLVGWAGKILSSFGRGFLAGLKIVFPGLGRLLTEGLGKLAVGILAYSGRLVGFGERLIAGLGTGILKGVEGLGKFAARVIGPILKPFVRAGSWLFSKGWAVVKGFGSGIATGAKAVGGFAKTWIIDPVVAPFRTAGSWLWARGVAIVSGVKNGIVTGAKAVGSFGKTWVIDPIVGVFKTAGSWLLARGVAIVSGLKSGIVTGAKAVGGFVKVWVIDPVVGVFKASGSWLWARGSAIVSGFKNGIVTGAKAIGSFGKTWIIDPVVGAFKTSGSWLWARGAALVSGFKSGIIAGAKGIGGWALRNVIMPSVNVFLKAGTWLVGKGSALISGLKSGIVSGIKGIGSWIKSNIIDPVVNAVKSFFGIHSPSTVFAEIGGHLVGGLFKGLATTNGTDIAKKVFGDMPSALGSIVKKGIVSVAGLPGKALNALGSLGGKLGGFFKGLFGGGDGGSVGKGVQRWAPLVSQVLSMLGAPATALGPVLKRINTESGGNPNAINNWDINAKRGDPSRGLMQTIGATFSAYAGPFLQRGIYDPLASIYAGINYAMHRYGANWINVMTRPGGYAKGTKGGLAPIGQTAWVGEKGAELMQVTPKGTRILSHKDSVAYAKTNGIKVPGYASGTVANAQARVNQRQAELERAKERHYGIQAAKTRLAAAKQELANAKRRTTTDVANYIANGLKKTLTTGTAAAINSAIKSLNNRLQNAGANSMVAGNLKTSAKLQALATSKASIGAQIATAKQFAVDQASNITDFLGISGTTATSVDALIQQMKDQQKTASDFASLTASLKARGASKDLLTQLAAAGPGSQLASILGEGDVSNTVITQLNNLVASGNRLATNFGRAMADTMYDAGAQAGKGFLTGLQAQQVALQKQMESLADALVTSVKKKLKIKSPSGVFRDQVGKMVALGTAAGIDAHVPHVVATAQRMADAAAGVSTRPVVIPSPAAGAARHATGSGDQQVVINARVFIGDREITDIVRVEAEPVARKAAQAAVDKAAYRAKVGRQP
ncbi:phage tail tape measure protein [Streptomyces sp. 3214.6]|uniref:phage tail tape measure protein n=1 Tax=Streptomyces sp. 3214.6 TaxID=1882757 RepID=UPI00090BFD89|nr:phage tail tape measure protein [Streptomyces sp. 3214.6]SHI68543.1 phage tail tape measure protein, TP901 family, core region [Streptomyces sp. 3214.6]